MKKIIITIVCFVCIVFYIGRVYYVNANSEPIVIKEYTMGEKVPYERDYNRASNMIIDGYSIEVLGNKLYKKQDFVKEFNIKSKIEDFTKYFYVVDVKFYNDNKENNTDSGIFLGFIPLITSVDYVMPEDDISLEVNPNLPDVSFALRHESSMDVKIVYALNEPYFTSEKQILDKNFKILITQYPTRKVLNIK